MRKRVFFLALLAVPALAACSPPETTVSGYTSDTTASLQRDCSDLATTGDMYRYCMEIGPQQAVLARETDMRSIATAAAR